MYVTAQIKQSHFMKQHKLKKYY